MEMKTEQTEVPMADPPVIVDRRHIEKLRMLASAAMRHQPEAAERLLQELERATIVAPEAMPENVATIGSEIVFSDDGTGSQQTVTLVLPSEADITRGRVSVMTPIGAALIGLAEGASIGWETRDGKERRLTIHAVSQPASKSSSE